MKLVKQKVLEFFNNKYDSEIEDEMLLHSLIKYRNSLHPDNHIGFEDEFTQKYNDANNLLTEYKKEIQSQTREIVLSGEIIQDRPIDNLIEIITLGEEKRRLSELNASYKSQIVDLKNNILNLEANKTNKQIEKEIQKYKPQKRDYGLISSTLGISTLIALSSQINFLSTSIKSNFPFDIVILQIISLCGFILCSTNLAIKSYISKQLRIFIDTVNTRKFRNNFIMKQVGMKKNTFTDDDIVKYIEDYIKENKLLRLYSLQNKFLNNKDLFIEACTDSLIESMYANKVIKSHTINRAIKTYSLDNINYYFEWENIELPNK